jgi:hypothetical protein
MQYAIPAGAVGVDYYCFCGEQFLKVDLFGEHWDMYQQYRKLPAVLKFNGETYKKTGWDSDRCKAYYKQSNNVAYKV